MDKNEVVEQENQESHISEAIEWSFPDVNIPGETNQEFNPIMEQLDKIINPEEEKKNSEEKKMFEAERLEIENLKKQYEMLKDEYEAKLQMVSQIVEKLKTPMVIIDDEIVVIMNDIIRQSIKKIIHKELNTDPQLILNIVNELKSYLQNQKQIMNIYLSENDFKKLDIEKNNLQEIISINNELSDGDIIIKSNATEIRAILNDMIDKLVRVEHD